ncbi:nuclease A inhibitor family protein [Trichocoleus sp. FACHB-262]|uniref:nuclease A inhibitor family protein n=1 Tax=Trichocoleus sp. FACHB-262 TaxID=2692869 RepID=UPI001687B110|nr:nuclease A inhibitor family protein [Trichocoleus sp. FACHB-262]MBD2123414.1 nuclease A inhibitor family protein [Trichocoleus sp. FACHB-262]
MSSSEQEELVGLLQRCVDGLLCLSESEVPFQVFIWELQSPITPDMVLQQTQHPSNCPVEVVDLDQFLEVADQEQDWHGIEEKEQVKRYQHLVEVIKNNLSDVQVYKIGKIKIDVYILGRIASGQIAGISTQVVET